MLVGIETFGFLGGASWSGRAVVCLAERMVCSLVAVML